MDTHSVLWQVIFIFLSLLPLLHSTLFMHTFLSYTPQVSNSNLIFSCLLFSYSPGDAIDGAFNGPAPAPWSIPITPDAMFRQHEKHCEVRPTVTKIVSLHISLSLRFLILLVLNPVMIVLVLVLVPVITVVELGG